MQKFKLRKIIYICSSIFIIIGIVFASYGLISGANLRITNRQHGLISTVSWYDEDHSDSSNFNYTAKDSVQEIAIETENSDIIIRSGTELKIEAINIEEDKIHINEENGKINIRDTNKRAIFGIGISDNEQKIIIDVPSSCKALNIESVKGDLELSSLDFETIDIKTNLGDIEMTDMTINKANIKTNVGNIEFYGDFKNSLTLKTNEGDIDIELLASLKEYDYDLKTNLGEVNIYDEEGRSYKKSNDKNRLIIAKTNLGSIEIDTENFDK